MDDLDDNFRAALRQLDQQSQQRANADGSRSLSAQGLAAIATNRNRRRNLSLVVFTVAATAIFWTWQNHDQGMIAGSDVQATAPDASVSQSIETFLAKSQALRQETEKLLAESRRLRRTTHAESNDPINDAASFAVARLSFRIDNGEEAARVRSELESIVDSFPNTFGAKEAERMLAKLLDQAANDQRSMPREDWLNQSIRI